MRPAIGNDIALIELRTNRSLRVLDLARLETARSSKPLSYFQPDSQKQRKRRDLLKVLHALIAQPVRRVMNPSTSSPGRWRGLGQLESCLAQSLATISPPKRPCRGRIHFLRTACKWIASRIHRRRFTWNGALFLMSSERFSNLSARWIISATLRSGSTPLSTPTSISRISAISFASPPEIGRCPFCPFGVRMWVTRDIDFHPSPKASFFFVPAGIFSSSSIRFLRVRSSGGS